jgi:periplasmic protein TonB
MENALTQHIVTASSNSYQDTIRRISASVLAERVYVFMPQAHKPAHDTKRSNGILFLVIVVHLAIIYLLAHNQLITPAKSMPVKPMLVSLIAPPASAPVLVPIIARSKPVVKTKPVFKKAVEKTIAEPTERLVEAATEQSKVEALSAPAQAEVVDAKTPPKAEPVVEEKVEPPRFGVAYLNNPTPAYPPLSRRMGEEGRVLLRVLVSVEGVATEVNLEKTSGSERLDQAAINAVKNWRFIPAKKNNQALSAYVLVPVKFSLDS